MKLSPFAALLLLAAPALAQDPAADVEARLDACLGAIDLEAVGARAEAFGAARDYEARIAGLCAAGDAEGAAAYAARLEAAYYAQDPDAARMRACLVEVLGEAAVATGDPCGD